VSGKLIAQLCGFRRIARQRQSQGSSGVYILVSGQSECILYKLLRRGSVSALGIMTMVSTVGRDWFAVKLLSLPIRTPEKMCGREQSDQFAAIVSALQIGSPVSPVRSGE
jgi:hypothetical protein